MSTLPNPLALPAPTLTAPGDGLRRGLARVVAALKGPLASGRERELERMLAEARETNEQLQSANERLTQLSMTDELTGLPNHRCFRESLRRELKRSLRTHAPLALVLFDIDDFKKLNDGYGHAVGDAVLARVAAVMRAEVREHDCLARYGGEEFALVAPDTEPEGALALAEKIRYAVSRNPYSVLALEGAESLNVSVSVGVSYFRGDERDLFNDADRALYRAKASGKDCVVGAD